VKSDNECVKRVLRRVVRERWSVPKEWRRTVACTSAGSEKRCKAKGNRGTESTKPPNVYPNAEDLARLEESSME